MTTASSTQAGSVVHHTFDIERDYPFAPARVFAAWATPEAKAQWFGADEGLAPGTEHTLDFRVGGGEHLAATTTDGIAVTFDARYQDIVEGERIVFSYDMHMNGRRISVSLATVQFAAVAGGTRLAYTEQGAYLDGLDAPQPRFEGTKAFLDELATFLAGTP